MKTRRAGWFKDGNNANFDNRQENEIMRTSVVVMMAALSLGLFGATTEAKASEGTWSEHYALDCANDGSVEDSIEVTCHEVGEVVKLRATCPRGIFFVSYRCEGLKVEAEMETVPKAETVPPSCPEQPKTTTKNEDWFDYQLGLHTSGLMVAGDLPNAFYAGGEFSAQLKLGGKWWLTTALGLGYARVGDSDNLALTESVGLQYRLNTDWYLGLVARHYVVLDGGGDVLQAVLPSLEIVYNINQDLQAVLMGGAGWGHYRVQNRVSAASSVAPDEYETGTRDDLTGMLGASLRARF
ncbi:MAG: hypothetical protein PHQ18_02355 [Patescibacteria group bacterium]|nr:hypothetical protein [Patescibacteria group bacterium]